MPPPPLWPPLAPVNPPLAEWSRASTLTKADWSSADLTGRFPVRSHDGFEYILVVRHRGYIHLVPLKNRTALSYVSAYKSVVSFFSSLSHPLTHLLLDNETSSHLTDYFVSISLAFQYVPPQNHRSLPAERSIQTAKNHIISVISSCHVTFPPNRWPDLLPQSELTLNTLLPWSPNPALSAYHGLHSLPFDFSAHPIHPPGQLVIAHDSPQHRKSWARHGTRGFYLSPATQHYRCFNIFTPLTSSYRVSQTLDHYPDPLFPFEDPTRFPSVPDPTVDLPIPIPSPPTSPPPPLTPPPDSAGVPPPPAVPTTNPPPPSSCFSLPAGPTSPASSLHRTQRPDEVRPPVVRRRGHRP